MIGLKSKLLKIALGTSVAILCLSVSEQASFTRGGTFMTSAEALIGAPLTPLSYAGVARRTTRSEPSSAELLWAEQLRVRPSSPCHPLAFRRSTSTAESIPGATDCTPVQNSSRPTGGYRRIWRSPASIRVRSRRLC